MGTCCDKGVNQSIISYYVRNCRWKPELPDTPFLVDFSEALLGTSSRMSSRAAAQLPNAHSVFPVVLE